MLTYAPGLTLNPKAGLSNTDKLTELLLAAPGEKLAMASTNKAACLSVVSPNDLGGTDGVGIPSLLAKNSATA